jgi:hypothetical protein
MNKPTKFISFLSPLRDLNKPLVEAIEKAFLTCFEVVAVEKVTGKNYIKIVKSIDGFKPVMFNDEDEVVQEGFPYPTIEMATLDAKMWAISEELPLLK